MLRSLIARSNIEFRWQAVAHGPVGLLQIPPSVLETMLVHVEQGYAGNGNPYHNNMHACDVLQSVNYFISLPGLSVSGSRVAALRSVSGIRISSETEVQYPML